MEYEFHWTSNTTEEIKRSAEAHIRKDQESGHSPITFCHEGTVVVNLSSPDPLEMKLVGNMKCGSSDGSKITFQSIEN
jgi:hypothetical protein